MNAIFSSGIIGIAGTIVGIFAERVFRRLGNVVVTSSELKISYLSPDEVGQFVPVAPNKATQAEYSVTLDIFNRSEEPAAMRDFSIEFISSGKVIAQSVPNDSMAQHRVSHGLYFALKLAPLNIPPKHVIQVKLFDSIEPSRIIAITSATEAVFSWKSPGGRTRKKRIAIERAGHIRP